MESVDKTTDRQIAAKVHHYSASNNMKGYNYALHYWRCFDIIVASGVDYFLYSGWFHSHSTGHRISGYRVENH